MGTLCARVKVTAGRYGSPSPSLQDSEEKSRAQRHEGLR